MLTISSKITSPPDPDNLSDQKMADNNSLFNREPFEC